LLPAALLAVERGLEYRRPMNDTTPPKTRALPPTTQLIAYAVAILSLGFGGYQGLTGDDVTTAEAELTASAHVTNAGRVDKMPPPLCEQDPTLCEPCEFPTATGDCPQEASGYLCCNSAGLCVPAYPDSSCTCAGCLLGFCANYSVDTATGNATCHDPPPKPKP
jgi:hypothetical protein